MITAEEFLNTKFPKFEDLDNGNIWSNIEETMIEFAKLHVEAALKQASENFKMKIKENVQELHMNDDWMEVDKNSILNSYSLDLIK